MTTHNCINLLSSRQYRFLRHIAVKLSFGDIYVEEWERHVSKELSLVADDVNAQIVREVADKLFAQMMR